MKLTLPCKRFLSVANVVAKSIAPKDTISQTLIKIDENSNKLIIQHRGSTSFFKGSVPISDFETDNSDVRQWSVDGAQLKVILSVIPKDEENIEIETSEDNKLFIIKLSNSKLKLPVFETTENIYNENVSVLGTVSAHEFLSNLQNLIKLTVTDEVAADHGISCLHIFGTKNNLTMMSTNTVALVEKKFNIEDVENDFTVLIKAPQAALLHSNHFNADDIVSLYGSETTFGYIDPLGTLCLVNKPNNEPIAYEHLKNIVGSEEQVMIDTDQFKYAIDASAKLSTESTELNLIFNNNGKVVIENLNNDQIEVPALGQVANTKMSMIKETLSILCSSVLQNKFYMNWTGNSGARMLQLQLLNSDNEVDENTFICITTNDK